MLYKNEGTGAIDLVMSPGDPDTLFAALWEFERKAWGAKTGGPDSGIWRSTDGGAPGPRSPRAGFPSATTTPSTP